jgi:hypothetical protein
MAVICRFDELRIKTDTQLLQLVDAALALGIREARQLFKSAGTLAFAEGHYLRARRALSEASRLIPLAGAIPEQERLRRNAQLRHLREMLKGLSVLSSQSADCLEDSPGDDWKPQPVCVWREPRSTARLELEINELGR